MTAPQFLSHPILCAGSPKEMGRAQGEAAATQVRGCHTVLRQLEAFQLMKPRWIPHRLFARLAERRARNTWTKRLPALAPEAWERMQGISEGAGLRPGAVQLLNMLEPLMAEIADLTEVPPLGGCSAIATRGGPHGPVLCRNFDYLPLIQPFYLLRDCRPRHGLRSLEFTCAPLAGTVDGINEAGLAITCNYAYAVDPAHHAGSVSMGISQALASCRDVAAALDLLRQRPRWGGGLLMLADAEGNLASLELSNTRAAVRRPAAGSDHLFHSNRYQTAELRAVELPPDARFGSGAPQALRGNSVHASAELRDARFAELCQPHPPQDLDALQQLMADHGPGDEPSKDSICMHSGYWSTTATLQLLPKEGRMRVAFDAPCRANLIEIGGFSQVETSAAKVRCRPDGLDTPNSVKG